MIGGVDIAAPSNNKGGDLGSNLFLDLLVGAVGHVDDVNIAPEGQPVAVGLEHLPHIEAGLGLKRLHHLQTTVNEVLKDRLGVATAVHPEVDAIG